MNWQLAKFHSIYRVNHPLNDRYFWVNLKQPPLWSKLNRDPIGGTFWVDSCWTRETNIRNLKVRMYVDQNALTLFDQYRMSVPEWTIDELLAKDVNEIVGPQIWTSTQKWLS